MPEISIDREFLRRFVQKYIELEVDNRAYRALASRASMQNLVAAQRYSALQDEEVHRQQTEFDGILHILEDSLDGGDDAAFRSTLYSLIPPL